MHYLPEKYLIYKVLEDRSPWFKEQIIFYISYISIVTRPDEQTINYSSRFKRVKGL